MSNINNSKPKVIDLYAGVGGLSLGAIRAGFELTLAVEWDKHAMKAHEINFPKYKHLNTDITELSSKELLKEAGLAEGELDGLIGGPPCQGFSFMGSGDVLDPRNDLFVKFFKLVKECKPKFFIAENVLGILGDKYETIREKAFDQVRGDYVLLDPMKFKASDFGAPTSRERVFFIGYRRGSIPNLSKEDFEKEKVSEITTVAKALKGLPKQIRSEWLSEEQSWRRVKSLSTAYFKKYVDGNIPDGMGDEEAVRLYKEEGLISGNFGTRHSPKVQKRYEKLKPGENDPISRSVRLKKNGLCPTLRAGTGSDKGSYQAVRPIHPTAHRVITPREAARLQGFPDWFQFAPSKWHSFRQIGNSVSPILAESILQVIAQKIILK
ncbi:MAG: DNA cytosine methyltransferase [Chloroflexi bacterium]|nr:DNA cytosine methyltransferase [Chloroflexota bacterium]